MNNFNYRVLRIEPNITAVQKCAASVCMCSSHSFWTSSSLDVVVVVVVFTLTDRASTIASNIRGCHSGTWSQRGTKVNGSHHGDNPLLRPTGIQIVTKSYATLQAMAPTNSKTVHRTSFTPYREQTSRGHAGGISSRSSSPCS